MRFTVMFSSSQQGLPVKFRRTDKRFSVQFGSLHTVTIRDNVEHYEGEYAVTPKVYAQSLPTADKFLINDLTVNAIPFFNVSNPAGGNTIYIGTMDEYQSVKRRI